ncbi:MAG: hypothetical protein KBB39_14205 [Phycicoccus sp.]|nr:hypothetical protein [Phycicoccus sp.]
MNPLLTDHIVLVTSVARPAAREGAFAVAVTGERVELGEARIVADAVAQARVVFLEAFHNPYHPLFQRSWRSWTPQ